MSSQSSLNIEEIWICPPLAFARFGQSPYPMENFHWAENDYSPRGTAETVIKPALTFKIDDATSKISAYLPEEIRFKDNGKWRPVCPFFELHGRLSDGSEKPIGLNELQEAGLSLKNIQWKITVANRKAYHYTLAEGDRVEATVTISGEEYGIHPLLGKSPQGAENPIIPEGMDIPLGQITVIRPDDTWPEVRLRVTPPQGLIYAPSNTKDRDLSALVPSKDKDEFLSKIKCILNPQAAWPKWEPTGTRDNQDLRTNPGGLYAQEPENPETRKSKSLGFLDDSNDGVIQVTLTGEGVTNELTAYARYTCCPPDFQPDRRPFVSIADGLSDLTKRQEVLEEDYIDGANWAETEEEIADLMQRVKETMEASNLDHQNLRSQLANSDGTIPFEPMEPRPGHPLPLTELGRSNHARFLAYEVFKQRLGQRPELFEKWIRKPTNEPAPYNKQMPAVMRGSDSSPMFISQRQYYLMKEWFEKVKKKAEKEGQEGGES